MQDFEYRSARSRLWGVACNKYYMSNLKAKVRIVVKLGLRARNIDIIEFTAQIMERVI